MQSEKSKQYDLFLSYHWRDHAVVEPLALALRKEGLEVFLDRISIIDTTRGSNSNEEALHLDGDDLLPQQLGPVGFDFHGRHKSRNGIGHTSLIRNGSRLNGLI